MVNFKGTDGGLRELALFAGAGGGILGGYLLGWDTVCAVEYEPYPASVLIARQNEGILPPFPIWDDVCSFDGRPWRGRVDVVSGGFPCQDISVAGGGEGLEGEKSGLWREMFRIIGEVRPGFAYIENSPRLVVLGLERVLCDLASIGFDAEWGVLSADSLDAPHERDRIWIVARNVSDADGERQQQRPEGRHKTRYRTGDICQEVSNTNSVGIQRLVEESQSRRLKRPDRLHDRAGSIREWNSWPPEPDVGRVVDGMAARMDRVKAVGNGQVSVVAAAAFPELCRRRGW